MQEDTRLAQGISLRNLLARIEVLENKVSLHESLLQQPALTQEQTYLQQQVVVAEQQAQAAADYNASSLSMWKINPHD